jgi:hypothetical protein
MWIVIKRDDASDKPEEISKTEINSGENQNNKEIFPIEWETGLDYFLHFNEAASKEYYNFKPITLHCSPNPEKQDPTWMVFGGPTEYHIWSVPCASAVHAGKITFASGGDITIQYIEYSDVEPSRRPKLVANTRNSVTSEELADWATTRFRFVN